MAPAGICLHSSFPGTAGDPGRLAMMQVQGLGRREARWMGVNSSSSDPLLIMGLIQMSGLSRYTISGDIGPNLSCLSQARGFLEFNDGTHHGELQGNPGNGRVGQQTPGVPQQGMLGRAVFVAHPHSSMRTKESLGPTHIHSAACFYHMQ